MLHIVIGMYFLSITVKNFMPISIYEIFKCHNYIKYLKICIKKNSQLKK